MHSEIEQKILTMLLEEFKQYNPPDGWRLMHVSGHEKRGRPGLSDKFFEMVVTIEKERISGI